MELINYQDTEIDTNYINHMIFFIIIILILHINNLYNNLDIKLRNEIKSMNDNIHSKFSENIYNQKEDIKRIHEIIDDLDKFTCDELKILRKNIEIIDFLKHKHLELKLILHTASKETKYMYVINHTGHYNINRNFVPIIKKYNSLKYFLTCINRIDYFTKDYKINFDTKDNKYLDLLSNMIGNHYYYIDDRVLLLHKIEFDDNKLIIAYYEEFL